MTSNNHSFPPSEKPKPFLVVDDQEDITGIIQIIIEDMGNTVECFCNPIKALEAFRNNPERYSGVITDLRMPYMNGDKLIEEIRIINSQLPIVIITANSDIMTVDQQRKLAITLFIEKPFTGEDIENAVAVMSK